MSLLNNVRLKFLDALISTLETVQDVRASRERRAKEKQHIEIKQQPKPEEDLFPELSELTEEECIAAWNKVTKLSEELNNARWAWNFDMYIDTTKLQPGVIVYVIGKREPTPEKPYITYKPEPRVVSSIHDSGVNGGTMFFTYTHRIEKPQSITKGEQDFTVVSDEDVIYSPLTKGHAEYICRLLNLQSKRLYDKQLLKLQQKQQLLQLQQNQQLELQK